MGGKNTSTMTGGTRTTDPYCKPRSLSTESYGLILLVISGMLFSCMGVFLKFASAGGIPSTELVVSRAVFQGCLVILAMMFIRQEGNGKLLIHIPFGHSRTVQNVVLLRGAFGGSGFILYFYSIKSLPLGDAITLFSLYPIITIFMARCLLQEAIKCSQLIAAFACVIGAALIAGPSFLGFQSENVLHSPAYNPIGYATALLGSFFGATVIVLVRKAGNLGAHTLQLIVSWAVFGAFFGTCLGMSSAGIELEGPWRMPESKAEFGYILALCCVGSVAHFLMNYAAKLAPAGLSAIARSSDILWSYSFEIVIFHVVPRAVTVFGVILIVTSLAGIALLKVQNERKNKDASILPTTKGETNETPVGEDTPLLSGGGPSK